MKSKLRDIFYVKKPWWRYPAVILFILIILTGSSFAYKMLTGAHNIVGGISSGLTGNKIGISELKGEKERRVNILLLGIGVEGNSGADLTDTIILTSFNLKDNTISMVSVPRDLYVKIPDNGSDKINTAYSYGQKNNYPGGGAALARDTVSSVLGVPINYYVAMDFEGFKEIVDTVGGIDISVDQDIYDYEYPSKNERGTTPFIIKKGDYHMDGELALKYARSRKSTSDFDRARRQQQVILAIKDKVFEKNIITNPKKLYELYNTLADHLKTDFQLPEIARVAELAQKFQIKNITNHVLDDSADGPLYADNVNGAYVLKPNKPDFSEVHELVYYYLVDEPLVKNEKATIEVLNGTGWESLASSLSEKLKKDGLNVVNIGIADNYNYTQTIIYDKSEGKKQATVSFLEKYLDAQVLKQKKVQDTEADITIVIGQNYDKE
jgi:LCP family protein required for cell wall assembly